MLAWLFSAGRAGLESWSRGGVALWGVACLVLALGAGWSALVIAGGLLCLHRDTLEARGVPYAPREPREWQAGPVLRAARRAIRPITLALARTPGRLDLRPGERVEVRSLDEILATLDDRGTLDRLPFMPEMSAFCGRSFRVLRRVEKINDYVLHTGLRRMRDAVLLEGLRCDGGHHGGCQASCHLLWKEAWLRRTTPRSGHHVEARPREATSRTSGTSRLREADLQRLTHHSDDASGDSYVCQMTEVARATTQLAWGDPRHYLRDLIRGNVRPAPFLEGVAIALFKWVQRKRGGVGSPVWNNTGRTTSPHQSLDLQPGELVRVRTKREIAETLTGLQRNRGLVFDAELVRFCGGKYRVAARVERVINEKSGKLMTITNPCIILEGVTATGEYLAFCPQNESIFWREIWLERSQVQPVDS